MLVKRESQRINILMIIIVFVFVALVSRLAFLQVVQGPYYGTLADGNRIRLIPIMAPRGIFYDRNGVALVSNRPGFTVALLPITGPVSEEVIVKLAGLLNMDSTEIKKKLVQTPGSFEPIKIKSDLGPDIVTKIEERRGELPGVIIEVQPIRTYQYNELGAHVFGYVSEINDTQLEKLKDKGYKAGDIIGKFGLEKIYDYELRGVEGGGQVEVDVVGKPVQVLGKKEPTPGSNLILTIDQRLQQAAETAIDEQLKNMTTKAAAVVVLNPKTGEVLAMVSKPGFNPNLFASGISVKDWNALNNNPFHPMDNKAISGEYPPGSTFKIVTGTAALELGKVTAEEKIYDSGVHWIIPKGNAEGEALGWLNFKEALSKSDNVYFYEMGNRLGIDNLEKYARMFGFGDYTGINLPDETDGLVANQRYKEKVYHQDWYLSETFDAAIGQGFNLATPLQVGVMMSAIANGGHRYKPYLVSKMVSPGGETVKMFSPEELGQVTISNENLSVIRAGLRDAMTSGGTAAAAFADFPIPLAGKTGTAENPHGKDHGWFIGYGPFDDPRFVVVVLVEQGGFGAQSAVPIGRKIFDAAFNLNQSVVDAPRILRPKTMI